MGCRATPALVLVGLMLGWPSDAGAGPPLIADDPNTIGKGFAQPIFAVSFFQRPDQTLLRSPILDLTVGVADSLDVTLVTSLNGVYNSESSPSWELTGMLTPGIKWEFLRTKRASLCLSPAFSFRTIAPQHPFAVVSLQGELRVGRTDAAVGFDAGYAPVWQERDEWFIALYGRSAVSRRVSLLAEIWTVASAPIDSGELGVSIGVDYFVLETLELLAAVSPGLVSFDRSRLNVRVYLGFQYTFARPRRGPP